jgi:hypothetical protein
MTEMTHKAVEVDSQRQILRIAGHVWPVVLKRIAPECGAEWVEGRTVMSIEDEYIDCEACLAKMEGR